MNEPFNLAEINRRSMLLPAPSWIIYFNVVEVVGNVIALWWAFLCGRIICKRPLFHTNLMRLISSLYVGICLLEGARLGVCLGAFFDPEVLQNRALFLSKPPFMWLEIARLCGGFSALLCIFSIILERILATRLLSFYEQKKPSRLILLMILCTWLLSPFAAACFYYSLLSMTIALSIAFFIIAFVFVAYQYLRWMNCRRLVAAQKPNSNYKLSERYQLQENIRVLNLMRRCTIMLSFCAPLIVFITYMIFMSRQNEEWIFYARAAINTIACLGASSFLFSAVTGTHIWRIALLQHLHQTFYLGLCCKRVEDAEIEFPKGVDGQQLAFESREEREIYFTQLKRAWS